MKVRLEGNTSGNLVDVNRDNELKVSLSKTPANTGGVRIKAKTSPDFRLRVGMDNVVFHDNFNYTVQDTNRWYTSGTSMTAILIPAGGANTGSLVFGNSTVLAGSGAGVRMMTFQNFPIQTPISTIFSIAQLADWLQGGEHFEFGLSTIPLIATVIEYNLSSGIFLRLNTNGIEGVIRKNSINTANGQTEVKTGIIKPFSDFMVNNFNTFRIDISKLSVEFYCDDVLLTSLKVPKDFGTTLLGSSANIFMRKYVTGGIIGTAAAPAVGINKMAVNYVTVLQRDIPSYKTYAEVQCGQGFMSYCKPPAAAVTTQTTYYSNNVAPTAIALTNTTGAISGIGGISAVTPSLATGTDGIIFYYLNIANTLNITGKNLYITGVTVQGVVTLALANAFVWEYSLTIGSLSVVLSTAETSSFATATTHEPRRIPIGIESFAVGLGSLGGKGINILFDTPLVIRPSEYVELIARSLGAAAATGTITVICQFNGYWE